MKNWIGFFLFFLLGFTTNCLQAQDHRFDLESDRKKVKNQFDYFDYYIPPSGINFDAPLSESGLLNISMTFWNDWQKSHPERVWAAIEKGLILINDSLDNPLKQSVFTIILTPESEKPLYRYIARMPTTTDFMEVGDDLVMVKNTMDSLIVVEYVNVPIDSKDSILTPIVYKFSTKDLSQFKLSEDWKQAFKENDIERRRKFVWKNFRSRTLFLAGLGVGANYHGNTFLSIDGGLYYLLSRPSRTGIYPFIGYSASYALMGFDGKMGLYLFHGLDVGAFSAQGLEYLSFQKLGLQLGAAHIKRYEHNGNAKGYKTGAYLGLHIPLSKYSNLSLDFASNFRFTPNNHVGYFGCKLKIYLRFF